MLSFHIPCRAFRATCGWKRRLCGGHFLLLLASISLLSPYVAADHPAGDSQMPGCSQESSQTPFDCMPGETFNNATCSCQPCLQCNGKEMFTMTQCTATRDTVCGCNSPTYYDDLVHQCIVDCELCPKGICHRGTEMCVCEKPECHSPGDIFCRDDRICDLPLTTPTTPPTEPQPDPFDQEAFPAWGIGLIAIGIVIGIIIFASCFLCMGLFSMHKGSRDPESQGSEGSENGLVSRESFGSVNTNSSYVSPGSIYPYLSNHNMLELLKSSNPQLVKSNMNYKLSSLQSSPISSRSSPKPGRTMRTVKLTKSAGSDKVTAIILQ